MKARSPTMISYETTNLKSIGTIQKTIVAGAGTGSPAQAQALS